MAQNVKFVITGGARIVNSGGNAQIVLQNGDWVNNGSDTSLIPGSGTVRFTGSTGNAFIDGSASTTFNNLVFDKGANETRLKTNTRALGTAQLVTGNVNLQSYTLGLGTTGSLNGEVYPNGRRFYCTANETGRITANVCLANGANADIAGLGLDLTMAGGAQCSVALARGHARQTSATQPVASIGWYYDITPSINTGFTYTFNFRYHEQELYDVTEGNFVFYRSPSYGATNTDWQEWGRDNGPTSPGSPTVGLATHNTTANTVNLGGINTFSRWTVSNSVVNPLPITLVTFSVNCIDNRTAIRWSTASEINNERFSVQRSVDLVSWEEVATVQGAGNSNQILFYEAYDERPVRGQSYYRLTQTDYDGTSETFAPAGTTCNGENGNDMTVYPNPAGEHFTVAITVDRDITEAELAFIDMNGKILENRNVNLVEGTNLFHFEAAVLPAGTYVVYLKTGEAHLAPEKLIIQH